MGGIDKYSCAEGKKSNFILKNLKGTMSNQAINVISIVTSYIDNICS